MIGRLRWFRDFTLGDGWSSASDYPACMFANSTARRSVSRSTMPAAFICWVTTPDSCGSWSTRYLLWADRATNNHGL